MAEPLYIGGNIMDNETMKFDVIVPVYRTNTDYLSECLESIKTQTHEHFQCFIIDGTPVDYHESEEITELCLDYVSSDSRFHYIIQSGKGVSQARNQGVSAGNADFIAFLDSDDYWYKPRLEWMAESITNSEENTVLWWSVSDTEHQVVSRKKGELYTIKGHMGLFSDYERLKKGHDYYFAMGHPLMTSAVVLRRHRFEAVSGFDEELQMAEDTDCWLRMLGHPEESKTFSLSFEPDLAGYYRCHPDQTTRLGKQTSAYQGDVSGDNAASLSANAKFVSQVMEQLSDRHKRPKLEDKPAEVSPDYWEWLVESTGGMNRMQLIFGNQAVDIDNEKFWV